MVQPLKADPSEPALSPEEYFAANVADAQEYAVVTIAHPIKKGEPYQVEYEMGFVLEETAEEDGYIMQTPFGDDNGFITTQDLVEKSFDLSKAEPAVAKQELPAGINFVPVGRGETIELGFKGRETSTEAPIDGFLIQTPKGSDFISKYELLSIFNYAGQPVITHEEQLVAFHHNEPVRGIILKDDTTFDFGGDITTVDKGDLLAEIKTPVGTLYGVLSADFANIAMRKQPDTFNPIKPGTLPSYSGPSI